MMEEVGSVLAACYRLQQKGFTAFHSAVFDVCDGKDTRRAFFGSYFLQVAEQYIIVASITPVLSLLVDSCHQ